MDNQQGPTAYHRELWSSLCASLDGRGVWGRMDACLCMAGSLCCSPGTITTLLIGYVKGSESCLVMSNSLQPHGIYSPWNSLGQNTGMGSLSLLQGIFPTKGKNPGLLHCRQILYHLGHCAVCLVWLFVTPWTVAHQVPQAPLSIRILQARILEWAAMPSSRGSSWPRNWTPVSCIAGKFFTVWATREAQTVWYESVNKNTEAGRWIWIWAVV